MAKRFTATEKWIDPWFCGLSSFNKLFWFYLIENCNHAGIWQVNWPLVRFHIPEYTCFESDFKGRIKPLSKEKWFIPKFIEFQYGTLNPDNRVHQSVIEILKKEGAYKPLASPLQGAKDKDKDKDKDKEEKGSMRGNNFDDFWKAYPKKIGKGIAKTSWERIKKPSGFLETVLASVQKQRKSSAWLKEGGQYIPNPATWLNQGRWEDEVQTPHEKPVDPQFESKIKNTTNTLIKLAERDLSDRKTK